MRRGDELMRELDDVFEPQRLEAQLRAELAQLGLHRVVHDGARHDGDRRVAVLVPTCAGGRGSRGR